jgi:hypothetical protein
LLALTLAAVGYNYYQELGKSQAELATVQSRFQLLANPKLKEIKAERQKVEELLAQETEDAKKYPPGAPMNVLKAAVIGELRLTDALLRQETAALESGAPSNIKANKSVPDAQLAQNLEKELEKMTEYINQRTAAGADLTGEAATALENELGTLHLVKAVVIRNYLTARYGLNSFVGNQSPKAAPLENKTLTSGQSAEPAPTLAQPIVETAPANAKKVLTVADILGSNSEWKVQGPWASRIAGEGEGLSARLLRLAAVNHAEINGVPQQASLFIACQGNKTEMYVTFALPLAVIANLLDMEYQIDDEPVVKETWNAAVDQKGAFSPRPIPLLRKMARANRILFRVNYQNRANVIETFFELDGLAEAIKPVQSACGWK